MAMTEQEWLKCSDPEAALELLRGKASARKMRLFSVACCRRILHLMEDERSRKVIEFAELHFDGHAHMPPQVLISGARDSAAELSRQVTLVQQGTERHRAKAAALAAGAALS